MPYQKEEHVYEKKIVIRHAGDKGDFKPGEVPEVEKFSTKCPGEKFEASSASGDVVKKQDVKIIICGTKDEKLLPALEKAEAELQKQDDVPAERKAELLAKIRAKIAELRAKG